MLIDFVTTLARLLTRHGNRVGAMFYGSRIERVIPARGGRIQVLRLINDLLKQPHLPRAPFTNLTPLLEGGLNAIKRRSLVFIISDFISAPGWERPLNLLNQRHEVLAVRLWDPREVELPDVGLIVMEDAETGEQLYVDTHDRKFRTRFEEAAQQREAALSEAFKHAGVDVFPSRPKKTWCAPSCVLPRCASSGRIRRSGRISCRRIRGACIRGAHANIDHGRIYVIYLAVMLLSLVLVPLFVVLYILLQRRRRRIAESHDSLVFMQGNAGRRPGVRRHIPPVLFLAGLTILSDRPGAPTDGGQPAQARRHGHPGI